VFVSSFPCRHLFPRVDDTPTRRNGDPRVDAGYRDKVVPQVAVAAAADTELLL
jgi:hypothetical protein